MTFPGQKAVNCLVLMKSVHDGSLTTGGNKMSWGRDAFPNLHRSLHGLAVALP